MSEEIRSSLIGLLQRWKSGEATSNEVHCFAERIYEETPPEPRKENAALIEVLDLLESMDAQLIGSVDVDAMVLHLSHGGVLTSEMKMKWDQYWSAIDWNSRKLNLDDDGYYLK